jgi:hypothetical protein
MGFRPAQGLLSLKEGLLCIALDSVILHTSTTDPRNCQRH